jgi:hypothetical protein
VHQDDAGVCVGDGWDVVRAGRVEAPFEDVSVDHDRAGGFAVSLALFDRADVHDQGTVTDLRGQINGVDPCETSAGFFQQCVDSHWLCHGFSWVEMLLTTGG